MQIRKYLLFIAALFVSFVAAGQNVKDVQAYQENKMVIITYSLDKSSDILVYLSVDGGATFSNALQNVSGDVGKNVTPGNKHVVWDVLEEQERLVGDNIVFKVVAWSNEIINLSERGTANCYIISKPGNYKFNTVKGNSSKSVGKVSSAVVLWETFGTDVTPNVGDLVSNINYSKGYISFKASDKKGNASIAAKDAAGNILWSWHIWLTDQPADQVYNNDAGIMMDRNLGATSATPGDVEALGLFYQWGRKDPFLGSSSISSSAIAESNNSTDWNAISSTISTGTIQYATSHPTTFITCNGGHYDWYYTGSNSPDNTRWQSQKTIYDPCPEGYRVPDGGIWYAAFGSKGFVSYKDAFDSNNRGFNLGSSVSTKKLTSASSSCWYPAAGAYYYHGSRDGIGNNGLYWSCTPHVYSDGDNSAACTFSILSIGSATKSSAVHSIGGSVRCVRE